MFNFLVIVIEKLLKPLDTFFESFNFLLFTSKVGTCSTECIFPVSFFVMFHVVFIIFYYICYKSVVVLILIFLYNFTWEFTVFNIRHFSCLQDIFISCVIQSILSVILFYLIGKLAWKMFKKGHRNKWNKWLWSLST
jgi:hypothetical protein